MSPIPSLSPSCFGFGWRHLTRIDIPVQIYRESLPIGSEKNLRSLAATVADEPDELQAFLLARHEDSR